MYAIFVGFLWYFAIYGAVLWLLLYDGPIEATMWAWLVRAFQRMASLFGRAAIASEIAYADAVERYRLS